ncbi:MAG: S1 family peptidase [Sandaracinus sp.]|nr:S1 family peptidase [Myxococcales bacterium]MCB9617874.1 S1 family peptidase [Sandaracinus sp.]MCB9634577.1 S1 family peptidase [Sandaracinus sp.]
MTNVRQEGPGATWTPRPFRAKLRSHAPRAPSSFACRLAQSPSLPEPDPGAAASPIINGTRTTEYPDVVAVVQTSGDFIAGLCTGTVIGNTTVVTAKHCIYSGTTRISTSSLRVFIGNSTPNRISSASASFRTVTAIATTPGPYTDDDLTNGTDIAVLTTGSAIGTPIREVARSTARRGAPITIVGFGRNSVSSGASGTKYVGTTNVGDTYVQVFQTMGTSRTCQGDSGGPAFDAAGRLIGVTSFGVDERCAVDMSFYTETAPHLALIQSALGREPPCTAATETCNGADDSCDGMVDPGCGNLGADCVDDEECESGDCRILGDRQVCTAACDPFGAAGALSSCEAGAFCDVVTCGSGACVPGNPGGAVDGATCTRDGDCQSAHCQRLASGRSVCGRPCATSGPACPEGFACDAGGTFCGVCLATTSPMLPFGTACGADSECASGDCDGFCTQTCTGNSECPGYVCGPAGVCAVGRPGTYGEPCTAGCETGLSCAEVDGESVCTAACGDGCPGTTVCDRGVCLPPGAVLGTACTDNAECRSGVCAGTCTRLCSDATDCPDGFQCNPAGSVSGCFPEAVEPPPPMEGGGGKCSASAGSGGSTAFGLAMLGVAVALIGRRRR